MTDSADMVATRDHMVGIVKMADQSGFEIVWAAEHRTLEMTIAPNPFQLLSCWAQHTKKIRLGVGVTNAAHWHPINNAGEAALLDLISEGRLEFGLGSGAYQREFDRMRPGFEQKDSWRYMQEMLPLVQNFGKAMSPIRVGFGNFQPPPLAQKRPRKSADMGSRARRSRLTTRWLMIAIL